MGKGDFPPEIDTSKPHPARMYDYFLGGKNHFAADRETADALLAKAPGTRVTARENRAFLGRAVRYLVAEAGVQQFLDIGTGLPTQQNVHDVAQAIDPSARVVYADNDPLVLAHARALLTSAPGGRTAYIQADLRNPEAIMASPTVRETLDLNEPLALVLGCILHFILDEDKPADILTTLLDALPSGSYLVASHATAEHTPPQEAAQAQRVYPSSGVPLQVRDSDEFAALAFRGLELLPPGVVLVSEWRPQGTGPRPTPAEVNCYGGVGRKPGAVFRLQAPGRCGVNPAPGVNKACPATAWRTLCLHPARSCSPRAVCARRSAAEAEAPRGVPEAGGL